MSAATSSATAANCAAPATSTIQLGIVDGPTASLVMLSITCCPISAATHSTTAPPNASHSAVRRSLAGR